jgi:predicted nucleic acid-binding protein
MHAQYFRLSIFGLQGRPNASRFTPWTLTAAAALLRRLDLTLRTADTINIAIAQRMGATLATFDQKMAAGAALLGLSVARV